MAPEYGRLCHQSPNLACNSSTPHPLDQTHSGGPLLTSREATASRLAMARKREGAASHLCHHGDSNMKAVFRVGLGPPNPGIIKKVNLGYTYNKQHNTHIYDYPLVQDTMEVFFLMTNITCIFQDV